MKIRHYDFKSSPRCLSCEGTMSYIGNNDSHHEDIVSKFKRI